MLMAKGVAEQEAVMSGDLQAKFAEVCPVVVWCAMGPSYLIVATE